MKKYVLLEREWNKWINQWIERQTKGQRERQIVEVEKRRIRHRGNTV